MGIGETVRLETGTRAQVSSEVTEVWVRLDGWEMWFITIVRFLSHYLLLFILERPSTTSSLLHISISHYHRLLANYRDVTMG